MYLNDIAKGSRVGSEEIEYCLEVDLLGDYMGILHEAFHNMVQLLTIKITIAYQGGWSVSLRI